MLDASRAVADVVLDHSECAQVFQHHRIDFCCRGDVSVERAARERGIDLGILLGQLEQAISERRGEAPLAIRELSTPALIDHIVDKHHAYLRKALPFLRPLAAKVARVHGTHNPKLRRLDEAVGELSESLIAHIDEEESRLFPALRSAGASGTSEISQLLAGMHEEHLAVAQVLEAIREASDDFALPDWACPSYRTLFGELRELEQDVFRHIHLENHVLEPRFHRGFALRIDLAEEAATLARFVASSGVGYSAKTLVRTADSRVVLIAMRAGARIHEHATDHTIAVQTIAGHVQLDLRTETADLPANTMLVLDAGVRHDVVAKEDSTVLLTIHWQRPRAG